MKKGPRGRAGGTAFTLSSRHLDLATPSRGGERLSRPEAAVSLPPEAWPGPLRPPGRGGGSERARGLEREGGTQFMEEMSPRPRQRDVRRAPGALPGWGFWANLGPGAREEGTRAFATLPPLPVNIWKSQSPNLRAALPAF